VVSNNLRRLSYNMQAALKTPTWRADVMALNTRLSNNVRKVGVEYTYFG
jgi:hypothetical protein